MTALLPTPCAQEPGGTVERYRVRLAASDGRASTFTPLAMVVQQLLPTPTTSEGNGTGQHGQGALDLRTAIELLPTPTASLGSGRGTPSPETAARRMWDEGRRNLEDAVALLPTPNAMDSKRGRGSVTAPRNGTFVPCLTLTDWAEQMASETSKRSP